MKLDSHSPELVARIKTAIPLAAGVSLIIFSPVLIVGLVVIVFAVIGSGELTAMLSKKEIILPEWFLPGCALCAPRQLRDDRGDVRTTSDPVPLWLVPFAAPPGRIRPRQDAPPVVEP